MNSRSKWPDGIAYKGVHFIGPKYLWMSADPVRRSAEKTFSQRLRYRVARGGIVDDTFIDDCLYVPTAEWRRFHGEGSTRKPFIYKGSLYPELVGRNFRTIKDFMRACGRERDYNLIFSRMHQGWSFERAIAVPPTEAAGRIGAVYLVTNTATGQQYVGVTRLKVARRWQHHCCAARRGRGQMLHQSIREHGQDSFQVETLEQGIGVSELGARERHWISTLDTISPNGLNMLQGGSLGYIRKAA